MNEPLTPWDTLKSIASSLTLADAMWVVIGIIGVFIFYYVATAKRKSETAGWKIVLFWLIAIFGWFFVMYMVAWRKIASGEFWAMSLLIVSAMTVSITVAALTRKARLWERIVSGTVIAVIGFGILATFGRGNQSWGYALVMGLVFGFLVGMLWSSWRGLSASIEDSIEDVERRGVLGSGDKKFSKRRVSEI
jgi:hypothetical protein